jgi:BirA family biotin operon repressor/biotin-[acetyl-CoA-carboxylase] ligase
VKDQIQQQQPSFNIQKIDSVCDFTYVDETESTNKDAMAVAKNNGPHLTCIFSEKQTAGRGRRGRIWQTFPYKSIACSVVIHEGGSDMLPLLTSLVLANSILEYTGIKTDIKWPNDLLIKNQKVAGILVESFKHQNKSVYIVGIGLNVNTPEESIDIPLTSLEEVRGKSIDRAELLCIILQNLKTALTIYSQQGWNTFKDDYIAKCITIGQKVTWNNNGNPIEGIAEYMSDDGTICLLSNDKTYQVRAGDIIAEGVAS